MGRVDREGIGFRDEWFYEVFEAFGFHHDERRCVDRSSCGFCEGIRSQGFEDPDHRQDDLGGFPILTNGCERFLGFRDEIWLGSSEEGLRLEISWVEFHGFIIKECRDEPAHREFPSILVVLRWWGDARFALISFVRPNND